MTGSGVDWYRVEVLMLRSFVGGAISESDMRTLTVARDSDPDRYRRLHREVKAAEIARIRQIVSGGREKS